MNRRALVQSTQRYPTTYGRKIGEVVLDLNGREIGEWHSPMYRAMTSDADSITSLCTIIDYLQYLQSD